MSTEAAVSDAWPPSPAVLTSIVDDWYLPTLPQWAEVSKPVTFDDLAPIMGGNMSPEEKDAYAAKSLKYKPLIRRILDDKISAKDIAREVKDARTALAFLLLLDQHPRTIWRKTEEQHITFTQTDPIALALARDHFLPRKLDRDESIGGPGNPVSRNHFLLPLMHNEAIESQDACLYDGMEDILKHTPEGRKALAESGVKYAHAHRDFITRFGRYPLRNDALGREWTPEERKWKEDGGKGF